MIINYIKSDSASQVIVDECPNGRAGLSTVCPKTGKVNIVGFLEETANNT